MKVSQTDLDGVLLIEPRVFGDGRGFFLETFERTRYHENGVTAEFVQDNLSRSVRGVLRGLHFQLDHPQGKLVYVTRGEVFDVAVDIRVGSPQFGKWFGTVLSDENHRQLFVPPGFAHGFCTLSETVDFVYKCTDFYHPKDEGGVIWNDPDIAIEWPIETPALSGKDMAFTPLSALPPDKLPSYEAAS